MAFSRVPRLWGLVLLAGILVGDTYSADPAPTRTHTREFWLERIGHVHRGMTRAEVEKLLPVHSPPQEKAIPNGHADLYAVDEDWLVTVPYDFTGFVDDERKNPYGVMHLYDNRVIGRIKLIHRHTEIDWKAYPPGE